LCFFEQPQFEGLLGNHLLQFLRLTPKLLDLIRRGGSGGIPSEPPLAGLEEFLRPAVIEAFGDPLAPAQFGNAVFAAKSIEYDPNLILSRIVFARRSPNLSDDLFGRRLRCPGFLSHLRSLIGYDEPEILLSSSH
jgi:hypothetical protein